MKRILIAVALLASSALAFGASPTPAAGIGGIKYVYNGPLAGIPATCAVGDLSFITDATAGTNFYMCTSANTWTQQYNSSAGSAAFSAITTGTNTTATMTVGSGASIVTTGAGAITATGAPLAGITGLGTGVGTALGIAIGSAGAPVLYNGAGGTPSSITLTNASGTASSLTAGAATNIAGGGAGQIPYQSGSGATGFVSAGTSGQVMVSAGTGTPTWKTVYGVCDIYVGDESGSALTNAQLGPQTRQCFIPAASTVVEVDVSADGGTPSVIVGVNHAGTVSNLLSAALSTAASGGIACSKTAATTCIDGVTTASATLQNTSIAAGDYIQLVSGTAGGTAKAMAIHITYSTP